MIIQKAQASICVHNGGLPEYPQNSKQEDAARYRKTQIDTVDQVLMSLKTMLSSLFTKKIDGSQNFKIVRLEDALAESPKRLQKDFRNVLNAGIKTRDPSKIRERGGTDFAFTIWLCGLDLYFQRDDGLEQAMAQGSTFVKQCWRWLQFLHEEYPENPIGKNSPREPPDAVLEAKRAAWCDPVRNPALEECKMADVTSTLDSYLDAIRACVDKYSQNLYNDPNVTAKRLAWCHNVVRNEGVWIPNAQAEDQEDEWILCLEF